MKRINGASMAENDTITMRLKIDSRGRIQIREEDRTFLGLTGGELLEVTLKRAKIAAIT
jgi:bifunctional DNA-binding transcriptional regulator/antitoxin component of YhaV-PrlF toxin-antitoxin module